MTEWEFVSRIPGLKKKSQNRYEGRCPCPNHVDKHESFAVYINGEWINPDSLKSIRTGYGDNGDKINKLNIPTDEDDSDNVEF